MLRQNDEYREEARRAPCAAAPDTGRFLRRMENVSDVSDQPERHTPAGAIIGANQNTFMLGRRLRVPVR
jgi:hypothetical protein